MIEKLVELEDLNVALSNFCENTANAASTKRNIAKLRKTLPECILENFDIRIARGKKIVAQALSYYCGACHLSVPSGNRPTLLAGKELFPCGNCGTYLFIPDTNQL